MLREGAIVQSKHELATLSNIAKTAFEEGIKNLHTALPGIVNTFDPETQLASIQPAIKRIFKTDTSDETILIPLALPVLINVPVIYPRGGGYTITFPVNSGDECLIIFCERSIDTWHQFGTVQKPTSRRFHSLSDAVAIVGLSSVPNKIPNYNTDSLELKSENGNAKITLHSDGDISIYSSNAISIESPTTTIINDFIIEGNLTVEGETSLSSVVTSNGKNIGDTHTHEGSPTAPTGSISPTGQVE